MSDKKSSNNLSKTAEDFFLELQKEQGVELRNAEDGGKVIYIKMRYAERWNNYIKQNPNSELNFSSKVFEDDVICQRWYFKKAIFSCSTFERKADFWGSKFEKDVTFFGSKFKEDAIFIASKFKGNANFSCSIFEGRADFEGVGFLKECSFSELVGQLVRNLKDDKPRAFSSIYLEDSLSVLYNKTSDQTQELNDEEALKLLDPLVSLLNKKKGQNPYCLPDIVAQKNQKIAFLKSIRKDIKNNYETYLLTLDNLNTGIAADFSRSKFKGEVNFCLSQFKEEANFFKSQFKGDAIFSKLFLDEGADFRESVFEREADFRELIKAEGAFYFNHSAFKGDTSFFGSEFKGEINFSKSKFLKDTSFERVIFIKRPNFSYGKFLGLIDFDFKQCDLIPNFQEAVFDQLPVIIEKWSLKNKENLNKEESTYRILKDYFLKRNNHEKELEYFRLEMIAKQKHIKSKFDKTIFNLYEKLSDYGLSIRKPFGLLLTSWGIFGTLLSLDYCINHPFLLSLFRTLIPVATNFAGMVKGNMSGLTISFLVLQTFLNIPLLFLLVLGIRNKFKIK